MTGIEQQIEISWCDSKDEIKLAISLFIENVSSDYISHGEVQSGRAIGFSEWNPDLAGILHREFSMCFEESGNGGIFKLAIMAVNKRPAGFAFVEIQHTSAQPYAILQDILVVKDFRGKHLGQQLLTWLEIKLQEMGIKLLFLESGINNLGAYSFFETTGFSVCSKIMMKELK